MQILKIEPHRLVALNLMQKITLELGDCNLSDFFSQEIREFRKSNKFIREQISYEYLTGKGIEFGALHNPLPVDVEKAHVVYADRLTKLQAIDRFAEFGSAAAPFIVDPDIIVDVDKDDISFLAGHNFNFFIANHFIEHIANPIRFIRDVGSIMKTGAILFISVPNKEVTFDKKRKITTNEHLWQDYINNETNISDEHIEDFLVNKEDGDEKLPTDLSERKLLFDKHRGRSLHVHVWDRPSFDDFLNWVVGELDLGLELMNTHDPDSISHEMIYLLRKH
ncbi:MAG: methyltransferase domain-containing protein [Nitrospirota bacterium]